MQRRGPAQELRATIDRLPLHVRQAVLDGIKGQRIIAGAHADGSGGVCPMLAADVHVPWKTVSQSSVATAQEAARAWDRYADANGSSRTATKRQLLALTAMLEASILQDSAASEMPLSDAIAEYERARSGRFGAEVPTTTSTTFEPAAAPQTSFEFPAALPGRVETPAARPSAPEPPAAEPEAPVVRPMAAEVPVARSSSRPRRDTGERDRSDELRERGGWAWLRPFRSYDEYEETLLRALQELDAHERQLEELKSR